MVHFDRCECYDNARQRKTVTLCVNLHTVAIHNPECHVPDGIHFNKMGYKILAERILESICAINVSTNDVSV